MPVSRRVQISDSKQRRTQRNCGTRAGVGRGVAAWQAGCFLSGWFTLVAALVSPLHEYAEHLFTAHMIEHELLMAVAAPLLAVSRPLGTFLHAVPRAIRMRLISAAGATPVQWMWVRLTAPLTATLLHGVAIWVWHIPVLLDGTIANELMHRLLTFVLPYYRAVFLVGHFLQASS